MHLQYCKAGLLAQYSHLLQLSKLVDINTVSHFHLLAVSGIAIQSVRIVWHILQLFIHQKTRISL